MGDLERYGIVFAYFRFFLSGFGLTLYLALFHSGGGLYQFGYVVGGIRNDCPYNGQSLCSTNIWAILAVCFW